MSQPGVPPPEQGEANNRRPPAPVAALVLAMIVAMAVSSGGPGAAAAEGTSPTPSGSARRPCSDRYPADGPAGLDLQLGCVAAEIVASYTGAGGSSGQTRISAWLLPLGATSGAFLLAVVLLRLVSGRMGRRLASASPTSWWRCPRCRSLNAVGASRCYACGQPWAPDALPVPSSAVQGFGARGEAPREPPAGSPDEPEGGPEPEDRP